MNYHWTFRATTSNEPFRDFESARWAWKTLDEKFPTKVCAVFMTNHAHIILPGEIDHHYVTTQLGGIMGGISRRQGLAGLWQTLPPPVLIPDRKHLQRQVRYVALNPCRSGLCEDPLEWYWSTHRELTGITWPKNTSALLNLINAVQDSKANFVVRHHFYVSADSTVNPSGTPLPRTAPPQILKYKSLSDILRASAAALRVLPSLVEEKSELRILFIQMAARHGWDRQSGMMSDICKITRRSVSRIARMDPHPGIPVAELCLSDHRLLCFHDRIEQCAKRERWRGYPGVG